MAFKDYYKTVFHERDTVRHLRLYGARVRVRAIEMIRFGFKPCRFFGLECGRSWV